jgi:hypothetical protein
MALHVLVHLLVFVQLPSGDATKVSQTFCQNGRRCQGRDACGKAVEVWIDIGPVADLNRSPDQR